LFLTTTIPNPFAFATIGGTTAGILSTSQQSTIATTSLIQKKNINYTTGSLYFLNSSTGKVERLDNVISTISMSN